jgi:hypothetical protein
VTRLLPLVVASILLIAPRSPVRAAEDFVRVRSSSVSAPCVEAVGRVWEARGGRAVKVETGDLRAPGRWDVLVGSGVELTRALEGGDADLSSDVDVARIPWVLHLPSGGEVRALSDVVHSDVEIVMPAGPAAYEARRALAEEGAAHVVETSDPARLRAAPVALVPVSLAGAGRQIEVDVPPIRVGAAVGSRAPHVEDAAAFVRFLGSEPGQQVFAACAAQ